MPAKSKAQQRFFGMVDAYKKGELDHASKSIKDAAESMSGKEVKKFASTKHKGLPNHVKKNKRKKVDESIDMKQRVRLTESQLNRIVRESLRRVLREEVENDDDASFYKGIDDYPDAPSAEEQWKDYRRAQGLDNWCEDYNGDTCSVDDWMEMREKFQKRPKFVADANRELSNSPILDFSRKKTDNGMKALGPQNSYARTNQVYNGYKVDDKNNPSLHVWYEPLPDEYNNKLDEMVKKTVKNVLKEIDYSKMPLGDFYERNKWFKQQTDNDFPNHGIKQSDNWQGEYANLVKNKEKQDKISAKLKAKEENALRRKENQKKNREIKNKRYKITKKKYGDGLLEAYLDRDECKVCWAILDNSKEPQGVWSWDVELYNDDTWLPYEETIGGSVRVPSKLWPIFNDMFRKIGMRENEDR